MSRACILLMLGLGCGMAPLLAAAADCSAVAPLILRVRIATSTPRDAVLESTASGGLRLVDAATGSELWSAGSGAGYTQQITGLDAGFGTSFAAVHLDADGVHDRLYAGDRTGRLWRFDLRAGARPADWAQAAVLADLHAPGGGRGFVAAPDITRIETSEGKTWLNIAIGTAHIGAQPADQRFYVLRDSLAGAPPGTPLVETDLEPISPPLGLTDGNARGYYLSLGSAQVLAQALTLDGRIHFTVVESGSDLLAGCASGTLPATVVPLSITVLRAVDGAVAADRAAGGRPMRENLRRQLADALPANAGVELVTGPVPADGQLPCHVATESLPDCFLDTRPRRAWWRREDAD